ncbi:MAG: hypothetical protein ACYDB1_08955, partial [Acidiferrobacteraceae bacterium]
MRRKTNPHFVSLTVMLALTLTLSSCNSSGSGAASSTSSVPSQSVGNSSAPGAPAEFALVTNNAAGNIASYSVNNGQLSYAPIGVTTTETQSSPR